MTQLKIIFANGVAVGGVGKMLVSDNGKQLFTTAKNIDGVNAEKVAVIIASKPIITRVEMLPTMSLTNVWTLSDKQTKYVIDYVLAHGCKRGTEVAIEVDNISNGERYSLEEAKQLGEGIGYELNKRGEIIPKVMPLDVRRERGLCRTINAIMVFDGDNEDDAYNNKKYHSTAVVDSLAK